MNEYPEHEKLNKVKDQSQAIGEFLEWLNVEKKYQVCQYVDAIGESDEDGDVVQFPVKGYLPIMERAEQLLAEFFAIDLDKLEEEKVKMLGFMRGDK